MENIKFLIPVSLILALVVYMSSCNNDSDECECCIGFGNTEKLVGDQQIKITVYSAFTPSNLKFCDSIVIDSATSLPIENSSICRPNPDSIYNDEINDYFHIEGLESFPENELIIRVPGDTTKLDKFINYSNSSGDRVFQGTRTDTTLYGSERLRNLTSRKYEFVLQLYNSEDHTVANRIDSIQGYFCIIRTPDFANTGCQGRTANDPLIK